MVLLAALPHTRRFELFVYCNLSTCFISPRRVWLAHTASVRYTLDALGVISQSRNHKCLSVPTKTAFRAVLNYCSIVSLVDPVSVSKVNKLNNKKRAIVSVRLGKSGELVRQCILINSAAGQLIIVVGLSRIRNPLNLCQVENINVRTPYNNYGS